MDETDNFAELFIRLDMTLTGKDRATAEQTARNSGSQLADPISYVAGNDREYYLSDGGYSRIVANEEGRVWVTSNSLPRVKEAWATPEAQELASRIGQAIVAAVERYEAGQGGPSGP